MSDSFHDSLDAARERAGFAHTLDDGTEEYRQVALGHDAPVKPSADVEALAHVIDPDAFEDHPIERRREVAALQWAARRHIAIEHAERVLRSDWLATRIEGALDQEIANRDNAEEWADRLAYAIAPVEQIGEHTSHNSPWENALEIALSTSVTPPVETSAS